MSELPMRIIIWLSLAIMLSLLISELSAQSTSIDSSKVIPSPGAGLVDVPLPQLDRLEGELSFAYESKLKKNDYDGCLNINSTALACCNQHLLS